MAEETPKIFFDGEYYDTQADVPDLGSWGSEQFPTNSYITGTVYGVYTS